MKKKYYSPQFKIVRIKPANLLTGSGGVYGQIDQVKTGEINPIIEYGGIDEDGELDPE